MNRDQQTFQVRRTRLPQFGRALRRAYKFVLDNAGDIHCEQRFDLAEAADVTRQMETQIRGDARAEKNVVAEIVNAQLQIAESEPYPVVSKIRPAERRRSAQPENREFGHRG
jgi:hypothetical protein